MKGNEDVASDECLDVCEMVSIKSGGHHPMTLLAYAGYHVRRDMVTYLLQVGASKPDYNMCGRY